MTYDPSTSTNPNAVPGQPRQVLPALPAPPGGTPTPYPTVQIPGGLSRNRAGVLQTGNDNTGPSGAIPFWQSPGIEVANRRITGQDIQDDPAIAAERADFERNAMPAIQNQMGLAGLGRSTAAADAVSKAELSQLAPMYEAAFGREGQRQSNVLGATENELGRRERSANRVSDANQAAIDRLTNLSNMLSARRQAAAGQQMQGGAVERGISQGQSDAGQNERMRLQALAEQGTFGPFGQLIPGALGSTTRTTGK